MPTRASKVPQGYVMRGSSKKATGFFVPPRKGEIDHGTKLHGAFTTCLVPLP